MSSSRRSLPAGGDGSDSKRNEEEEEDPHSMCIPGLGGSANRPKPRVLGTSFFGYVPDAFSMKTPTMPSERAATTDNTCSTKINIQVRHFSLFASVNIFLEASREYDLLFFDDLLYHRFKF